MVVVVVVVAAAAAAAAAGGGGVVVVVVVVLAHVFQCTSSIHPLFGVYGGVIFFQLLLYFHRCGLDCCA